MSKFSKQYKNSLLFDFQEKFIQIKTLAEAGVSGDEISRISSEALSTLNYVLFANHYAQTQLELTSVSAAGAAKSALFDIGNITKNLPVDICFETSQTLDLVYSNSTAIRGIVFGLATGCLNMLEPGKRAKLVVSVQQTNVNTQRVGIFSNDIDLRASEIRKSDTFKENLMVAPELSANSGVGFYISNELSKMINSKIQQFNHRSLPGVGFYVPLSNQLQLV